MRLVVGISGATGSIYGIRVLEVLKEKKIETHLIITSTSKRILLEETSYSIKSVEKLASYVHEKSDLGAPISSGSFETNGMVVIPCSTKTLSGIAHSYNENLLIRAVFPLLTRLSVPFFRISATYPHYDKVSKEGGRKDGFSLGAVKGINGFYEVYEPVNPYIIFP